MPAWVQTPRSGQTWGQSILGSWLLTPRECTLSHSEGSGLNSEPESRRQVWLWGQQRLDLISSGIKKKREREKKNVLHIMITALQHTEPAENSSLDQTESSHYLAKLNASSMSCPLFIRGIIYKKKREARDSSQMSQFTKIQNMKTPIQHSSNNVGAVHVDESFQMWVIA